MRLLKIGRDTGCDIVLSHPSISSLHAEITLTDSGDIMLEDKGSLNGTFVMDQRIKPGKAVKVTRGDKISFANIELPWGKVPMPEDNSAYKAIIGIGKHFSNDIQVSGATVSRYHATIKVGKDGKVYIVDHSKNGTTVNGSKIPKDTPYRITRNSIVACGGVPLDIKNHPLITRYWGNTWWKYVAGAAATILIVVGIIFLITGKRTYSDTELFNMHHNDVVMLCGIYHYEVEIGKNDMDGLRAMGLNIPKKLLPAGGNHKTFMPINNLSSKELIEIFEKKGTYGGTGFFISEDGQIITNLHVVKPWIFNDDIEILEDAVRTEFAQWVGEKDNRLAKKGLKPSGYASDISQVKVKGVLDYIALIPNGEVFDEDNIIKCKVVSAGENKEKDVALIQTVSKRLPTSKCTYINLDESLEEDEDKIKVGDHIYTLGYPFLSNKDIQKEQEETGMRVIGQGGNIIQEGTEFEYAHNAPSYGGASGSPIFNKYNKLIGVHHAGMTATQGYNYGVKVKYVKELIKNPHVK